ncbi:sialate O-acetylesterase [Escherichia coli]|uniref:sialate O-acetylesterase n=2 Tax=Escherichia coli TaxID=562 RepID=UPI001CD0EEF9|nr:sialate O-acetylesterase [Escherichia coli]
MSENNYSALMIKSALNQSVDIDSYILPGIYPVSSGNASSPHPDSGVLVVYSGTVLQRSFISGSVIIASSSYDQENNVWGEWNFAASRNDLLSSEKGFGASLVRLESGKTLQQEINSLEHLERSADVYDVFITYGQSNSAGEAILSGDTSGFPPPLKRSLMYDFTDGTIKPIIQKIVSSSGVASSGHAWGEFCNEWYRLTGRGAVIVHCGRGATSIAQLSKGYTTGAADYYGKMVAGVAAAKARMTVQGFPMGGTFMLCHHGETDQQLLTTFDVYRAAFLKLFEDVDSDIGLTRFCNFTVGCPSNRPEYAWATIQNAQRFVCSGREKMLTVFDGCPCFLLRDGNVGPEGVHYTQKGYNTMGREGAKGLWSSVGAAENFKTDVDLAQYNRFVAPWSRAAQCAASVRWAGSTNSWGLLHRANDTGTWRPANINKVITASDGNSLEFTVSDKATCWFTMSAGISRNLAQQGLRLYAEPLNSDTDFKIKVVIYADISLLLNTVTGEMRALKGSSLPGWMLRAISASITAPGIAEITHGSTLSYPIVSYYGSQDGKNVAASVSLFCPNRVTTRINCSITVNDQNPWVSVSIPRMLIKPDYLYDADSTINVSGLYAPEF